MAKALNNTKVQILNNFIALKKSLAKKLQKFSLATFEASDRWSLFIYKSFSRLSRHH